MNVVVPAPRAEEKKEWQSRRLYFSRDVKVGMAAIMLLAAFLVFFIGLAGYQQTISPLAGIALIAIIWLGVKPLITLVFKEHFHPTIEVAEEWSPDQNNLWFSYPEPMVDGRTCFKRVAFHRHAGASAMVSVLWDDGLISPQEHFNLKRQIDRSRNLERIYYAQQRVKNSHPPVMPAESSAGRHGW